MQYLLGFMLFFIEKSQRFSKGLSEDVHYEVVTMK